MGDPFLAGLLLGFFLGGFAALLLLAVFRRERRLLQLPAKWRKLSSSNEEIRVGGRIYRGSGTVWNECPSGRRCSTGEETALEEIAQLERWKAEEKNHG